MATVTGQKIVTDAVLALKDPPATRWSRAELLSYLNAGQTELVTIKPEASAANTVMKLAPGVTKQATPPAAITLLDVTRNMGADGTVPGRAITIVSKHMLDSVTPTWGSDASAGYVMHFTYDPRNPKVFYIYKKAPATDLYVELIYSTIPAAAADTDTGFIGVDDIYANALLDYVLYRAYAKDAETKNASLSIAHYQAFASSLGVKVTNDSSRNPNTGATPFNPAVPSSAKL